MMFLNSNPTPHVYAYKLTRIKSFEHSTKAYCLFILMFLNFTE